MKSLAFTSLVASLSFFVINPVSSKTITTKCVFRDDVRNTKQVIQCKIKTDSQGFAESISWPVGDGGWRTVRANEGGWYAYGNAALENDDGRIIYPQ